MAWIRKCLQEGDQNWDQYVPIATLAINFWWSERLKMSPMEALFGKTTKLPSEVSVALAIVDDIFERFQAIDDIEDQVSVCAFWDQFVTKLWESPQWWMNGWKSDLVKWMTYLHIMLEHLCWWKTILKRQANSHGCGTGRERLSLWVSSEQCVSVCPVELSSAGMVMTWSLTMGIPKNDQFVKVGRPLG